MSQYRFPPRTGFAFALIALGLFMLLDRLDIYDFGDLVRTWWPLTLIYLGLQQINSTGRRNSGWSAVLITAGALLILSNLDLFDSELVHTYWPVIFLVFGLYLLFDAFRSKSTGENFPASVSDDQRIRISAVLTGNSQTYSSQSFQGGSISCILGGTEIDLRQCDIKGTAVIDVTCILGGCEIRVPEDWNVIFKGSPVLGGFEDSRKSATINSAKVLEITGLVLLGGLDVK